MHCCPPRCPRLRAEYLEDRLAPAVYDVTTSSDVVNASDGLLSLREAILAANASVGVADVINAPAGTYVLALTGAPEDAAATGDLDVSGDLTIQGSGAATSLIDGNQADRVFDVRAGSLSLAGLTVRNGFVTGSMSQAQGGGIRSLGPLSLINCVVTGNQARGSDASGGTPLLGVSAQGGGIWQGGPILTLTGTIVSDNQAMGGGATGQTATAGGAQGGGIYQLAGTLILTACSVMNNQATGGTATSVTGSASGTNVGGGGIFQAASTLAASSLTLDTTTVSGNRAAGGTLIGTDARGILTQGGGLLSVVPVTLRNSAVVNNQAVGTAVQLVSGGVASGQFIGGAARGGGIYAQMSLTVQNSTVSDNRAEGGSGTAGTSGFGGDGNGGGVFVFGLDDALFSNCTVALNAAAGGAGSFQSGQAVGGGIRCAYPSLIVRSTIVAANTAQIGPDISRPTDAAPVSSLGNNLIGVGSGISGLVNGVKGDQVGGAIPLDPRLGPLANNGGPTPTHAVLADSPAIDRGDNALGLANDQRGVGLPRAFGPPDVGAVERTEPGVPTASAALPGVTTAGADSYQFVITFADDSAIAAASIGTGAVRVTGPKGFGATPTLVSLDNMSNGPMRLATFRFTPPGGTWDGPDAGLYTVSVGSGAVTDTGGRPVPPGALGAVLVDLPSIYQVTNVNDAGAGSLRQAVYDANLTTATDTIVFDPSAFNVPRTITLSSGTINVNGPTNFVGSGSPLLTVSGINASRIFFIDGPGSMSVTLSGMTLTAGRTNGIGGGAILNADETLSVNNCAFTNNNAPADSGGAIGHLFAATLVVRDSSFAGNTASNGGAIFLADRSSLLLDRSTLTENNAVQSNTGLGTGGAVCLAYSSGGSFQILNSTLAANSGLYGGAVYVTSLRSAGVALLVNSTLSNNTGGNAGGAIMIGAGASGPLTIENVTITGNHTIGNGGGLYLDSKGVAQRLVAVSSIIAGNSASTGPDIANSGTVDLTYCAVGSAAGFTPSAASGNNLPFGSNLVLGPLADNGGPTKTHALSAGSPAINAGSNPANLTTDQRGPGFARVSGGAPDIGAFEVQMAPLAVTSVVVNAGAAQRSMVNQLTVSFAGLVTFRGDPAAAFQLARTGPGGPTGTVAVSVDLSPSTAAQTIAKLTFSGALTEGPTAAPSLVDGNYTLTVLSGQVVGGLTSGDNVSSLFRLFGDLNGDRTVNVTDLTAFRNAFGATTSDPNYVPFLDLNGDGVINLTDLTQFRNRFGVILP